MCLFLSSSAFQAAYNGYATVPPSLQEDLLTITRIARVVQSDLYDSTKQCCSSTPASTAAFAKYNTNLTEVISTAPINQTAVLETGSYPAATPSTSIPLLTGRLLNSAGVKNCVVSRCLMALLCVLLSAAKLRAFVYAMFAFVRAGHITVLLAVMLLCSCRPPYRASMLSFHLSRLPAT